MKLEEEESYQPTRCKELSMTLRNIAVGEVFKFSNEHRSQLASVQTEQSMEAGSVDAECALGLAMLAKRVCLPSTFDVCSKRHQ